MFRQFGNDIERFFDENIPHFAVGVAELDAAGSPAFTVVEHIEFGVGLGIFLERQPDPGKIVALTVLKEESLIELFIKTFFIGAAGVVVAKAGNVEFKLSAPGVRAPGTDTENRIVKIAADVKRQIRKL